MGRFADRCFKLSSQQQKQPSRVGYMGRRKLVYQIPDATGSGLFLVSGGFVFKDWQTIALPCGYCQSFNGLLSTTRLSERGRTFFGCTFAQVYLHLAVLPFGCWHSSIGRKGKLGTMENNPVETCFGFPCESVHHHEMLHDLRRREETVAHYCTIPPTTRALLRYLRERVHETPKVHTLQSITGTVNLKCERLRWLSDINWAN